MSMYTYQAYDSDNSIRKGQVESNSEEDVILYLKSNNLHPISIKKLSILNTDIKDLRIFSERIKLRKRDLAFFCRQMTFVISSGLPIAEGLMIIESQCSSKLLKKEISSIKDGILRGENLSNCMSKRNKFPQFLCGMTKIGEESGLLHTVMERMADHYEKEANITEEIKSIMIYPTFVFATMIVVTIIAITYFIPSYAVIFLAQDIPLPTPTRFLIDFSEFVNNFYIGIIGFLVALIIAVVYANKNASIRKYRDKLLIRLPILKKALRILLSLRFSQAMGLMLHSGVPILDAISITKKLVKNYEFEQAMEGIHEELKKGISLKESIENIDFFAPMLINMVNMGERSGELANSLNKSAEHFSKEMDVAIKRLEKLIEPVITIVLGMILAFLMLAITLPTFYLTNSV